MILLSIAILAVLNVLYKNISLNKSKILFQNSNISFSNFTIYLTLLCLNKIVTKKILIVNIS